MMASERHGQRWSATADVVLITVFLCALVLPIADRLLGLDHAEPLVEKRILAPLPDAPRDWAALRTFPHAFEQYWNDTFGFRRALIRVYNRILFALGMSPLPDQAIVGRDGWFFFTAGGVLEEYRGERPFSDGELARWQFVLEARRDWLADRGIPYLFVIAPSKESIYPEYMPHWIRRGAVRRLDQLLAYLATHSDFEIVDPRPLLQSAKRDGPVYRKTDSHWNERGALVVEEAIAQWLARMFPAITPLAADALEALPISGPADIVTMLGLPDVIAEPEEMLVLAHPRAHQVAISPGEVSLWTEVDDPRLPRGVFLEDSFGRVQSPLLAEHFSRLRHTWTREMDPTAVAELEQAQVVVQELTERSLLSAPPEDPTLLHDNRRVRKRFDASSTVLARFANDRQPLSPLPGLALAPSPDGALLLDAHSSPASAELAPITIDDEAMAVVHATIDSPVAARLELWYQTRSAPDYDPARSLYYPLRTGSNDAWFVLAEPEVAGPLRLDVTAHGTYRLTALEVRAVSRR
jgi:hypothetical protein